MSSCSFAGVAVPSGPGVIVGVDGQWIRLKPGFGPLPYPAQRWTGLGTLGSLGRPRHCPAGPCPGSMSMGHTSINLQNRRSSLHMRLLSLIRILASSGACSQIRLPSAATLTAQEISSLHVIQVSITSV